MLHVHGNPFTITVAFEIRGDLEFLPSLRAPRRPTRFDRDDFRAVFSKQTGERRADNAGGKTNHPDTFKQTAARSRRGARDFGFQPRRGAAPIATNPFLVFAKERGAASNRPGARGKSIRIARELMTTQPRVLNAGHIFSLLCL